MSSAETQPSAHDRVRILDPLEITAWDSSLKKFSAATFFHTAAWARVLQSTYGYRPTYFADGSPDNYEALLPVMEIDSWLTGRRGVSLPFTDACDPLGADSGRLAQLFEFAKDHGKRCGWKYLEYRGGSAALGDVPVSCSYLSHTLALQPDETALFARFDSSVRQAVRKAEQNKLTIEFSQTPAGIRTFYDLFCLTRQKHGAPPQPFAFFENIQRHVLAKNSGWAVLARQGNVPVAGAVFVHFGKNVLYKFGASNQAYQQLRANNLVMWEGIRRFARDGFSSLDFGRSDLHHDGLRRFKLSWGAEERRINYFRFDLRKAAYVKRRDEGEGISQRLGRYLPRFLSRLIGLLLYKHIATLTLSLDWSHFGHAA